MARFGYYDRLPADSKRTYRKSDAIARIEIPEAATLVPLVRAIEPALAAAQRASVERACQALADALNARIAAPRVVVRVLERRPSNNAGELHGLYEPDEVTGGAARITLWMRTAQREQVVKFRTFLRTLVHELCHHFDYEVFALAETFHTQGFYNRESALLRELLGEKQREPRMNADNPKPIAWVWRHRQPPSRNTTPGLYPRSSASIRGSYGLSTSV